MSVREILFTTLPKDEHVDGIYRDLETILIMPSQFYFKQMNLERTMTNSIGSVARKYPLKLQLEGMEHPSILLLLFGNKRNHPMMQNQSGHCEVVKKF